MLLWCGMQVLGAWEQYWGSLQCFLATATVRRVVGVAEVTQYSAKQGAGGCKRCLMIAGMIRWVTILGDSLHEKL